MLTYNSEMNFFAVSDQNELLLKPLKQYRGFIMNAIKINPNKSESFITELNLKKIIKNKEFENFGFDYIWSFYDGNLKIYNSYKIVEKLQLNKRYISKNNLDFVYSDIYKNKLNKIKKRIDTIILEEYSSLKYKNGYIINKTDITNTQIYYICEYILKNIQGIYLDSCLLRTIIEDLVQISRFSELNLEEIEGYLNGKAFTK